MKISSPEALRPYVTRARARLRAMLGGVVPPDAVETWRGRLRTRAARWLMRPAVGEGKPAAVLPGLDTRPAPMRPLHPPAAINDNPLDAIQEAVERELRASGHLR